MPPLVAHAVWAAACWDLAPGPPVGAEEEGDANMQCSLSLEARVAHVAHSGCFAGKYYPFFPGETEHENMSFEVYVSDAHFLLPTR